MIEVILGAVCVIGVYIVYNMLQYSSDLRRINEAAYKLKRTKPKKKSKNGRRE